MSTGMAGFLQFIMAVGGSGVIVAQLARFVWRIKRMSAARAKKSVAPPMPPMPYPPYQAYSVTYQSMPMHVHASTAKQLELLGR